MKKEALATFIKAILPISEEVLNNILSQFDWKLFKKNEFLVQEGKISDAYYFLAAGFMRAYTHDHNGNEVTTYFFPENRVVFECSSFFLRVPSVEYIQAVTDCEGFVISFDKLNNLFHSIPQFREFGRAMLVKEFALYKQRTLAMINKSAEERYEDLISSNHEIFQFAQLRHIASYLGMTDTSLSRIRKEIAKK